MDNPTGTIHSLVTDSRGRRAIVDVDVALACPRCASGRGCGAGLLGGGSRIRRVEASVNSEIALAAGDSVEIALASSNLFQAAVIVWGLPLAGGVGFAGLAYLFALGDAAAALAALVGLSLGLLLSRSYLQKGACIDEFVPHVEKRLPSAQTGT
ncbi:MAG: SoxR reducing system RseC family protein [Woeseiaceae bacterium]